MNPSTNRFERLPADQPAANGFIEFAIGEQVQVKGYVFEISKVSANSLHLRPVGLGITLFNPKPKEKTWEQR